MQSTSTTATTTTPSRLARATSLSSHRGSASRCWRAAVVSVCISAIYLVSFQTQPSIQDKVHSAASDQALLSGGQFPLISAKQKCDIDGANATASVVASNLDLLHQQQQQQQNALQTSDATGAGSSRQIRQSDIGRLLTTGKNMAGIEKFHEKPVVWDDAGFDIKSLYELALITKIASTTYSDLYQHQYDDFEDLKVSGGPQSDQDKCIEQLEQLNRRVASQLDGGLFASADLNVHQLMDSFGRPGSGMLMGNLFWEGEYDACLSTKILLDVDTNISLSSNTDNNNQHRHQQQQHEPATTSARYCVARLMHPNWRLPKQVEPLISFKTAVCLPRACDSQNYKNKFQLVKSLVMTQASDFSQRRLELTGLYCLPDDESPLRAWWRAPVTLIGLALAFGWLLLVAHCTVRDNQLQQAASAATADKPPVESCQQQQQQHPYQKLYRSLSISRNFCALIACSKPTTSTTSKPKSVLDFGVIEGVKVLSLCYIICGHIIMILPVSVLNPVAIGNLKAPLLVSSNLMPAFAVNAFFTITGLLTANMVFKAKKAQFLFKTPSAWAKFLVLRYIRIMPLYALVVYYTKHIAKYTSDGPYWDYATSSLSQRKLCEQESWSWALLFGANFKSPLEHCVPSAWYLANDFQFMMVTPVFLYLLDRYETAGKRFVYLCMTYATISSFMSVFTAPLEDFKPIAAIMPHAFKTYVNFLTANYTYPQNRIQAYLVGLLIGQALANFESRKLKYLDAKQALQETKTQSQATLTTEVKPQQQAAESATTKPDAVDDSPLEEPKLEGWFVENATALFGLALLIGALIPSIAHRIPYTFIGPSSSKVMVSFIMPFYHLVFSAGVGAYLMAAIAGQGNKMVDRILANPIWVPMSRLSLVVMLINIEVICFLFQSAPKPTHLNMTNHLQMVGTSILCSYAIGTIVYLLFEAPLKAIITQLMTAGAGKMAEKKKIA